MATGQRDLSSAINVFYILYNINSNCILSLSIRNQFVALTQDSFAPGSRSFAIMMFTTYCKLSCFFEIVSCSFSRFDLT